MTSKRDSQDGIQSDSQSWKAKLKPGAVKLLAGVSENFQSLWERYREAIPQDEIEKANLKDWEWENYYKDLYVDAEIMGLFLDQDLFVQTMQKAFELIAKDRNELLLLTLADLAY